ncbi:MAG: PHP domain-containing protein [Candidatus Aminicenantaceae bacterium]
MIQKLKVDLHTHTMEDPSEKINYDATRLIDRSSEEGYDVLAITNHYTITYNQDLVRYAEKKGILLLPGVEARFSRKHILIINPDFQNIPKNLTLEDLAKIKDYNNLIIAPHPFFPGGTSLGTMILKHISFFDALEFCHCYNHSINFNKKAVQAAHRYNMPLIGTSDCHYLWEFGSTYSLVESEKRPLSIIKAIKEGKIEIRTNPLSMTSMSRIAVNFILANKLKVSFRI